MVGRQVAPRAGASGAAFASVPKISRPRTAIRAVHIRALFRAMTDFQQMWICSEVLLEDLLGATGM